MTSQPTIVSKQRDSLQGWKEILDTATNRFYYHDPVTGRISWTHPKYQQQSNFIPPPPPPLEEMDQPQMQSPPQQQFDQQQQYQQQQYQQQPQYQQQDMLQQQPTQQQYTTDTSLINTGGVKLDDVKPIMYGYLTKEGGRRKNWKKRYHILYSDGKLCYFKGVSSKNKTPEELLDLYIEKGELLGSFDVKNVGFKDVSKVIKKKYCFEFLFNHRTYHCHAASEAEFRNWITGFSKAGAIDNTIKRRVVVIGSENSSKNQHLIRQAYDVGEGLAKRNCVLITSGYGGSIEAACQGAATVAGAEIEGHTCPKMFPNKKANSYVTKTFQHETLSHRWRAMIETANIFVILPGGLDVACEFLMAWHEVFAIKSTQKVEKEKIPKIYAFKLPWANMISMMTDSLSLSKEEVDLVHVVTSVEGLMNVLDHPTIENTQN